MTETLDATGWRCPMPVVLMEKALRRLAPGASLKVLADDPLAVIDIPHFAAQAAGACERLPDENGAFAFLVTAGGGRPSADVPPPL